MHLECATHSEQSVDRHHRIDDLWQKLRRKEISWQEFTEQADSIRQQGADWDIRFTGTALFVRHENRRFLITARHVLWDEASANRNVQQQIEREEEFGRRWPTQFPPDVVRKNIERAQRASLDQPFRRIFRVSGLDELLTNTRATLPSYYIRLPAGILGWDSYSFSEPSLDLAVVSLEGNAYEPPMVAGRTSGTWICARRIGGVLG